MREIDETTFLEEADTAAQMGWLYQLVDPAGVPHRSLSPGKRKKAAFINNRLLAQKPSDKLYLYPTREITDKSIEEQVANELSNRSPSLLGLMPFNGWLITKQACTTVASYLARQLAQASTDGRPALLRFHDPRVLEHLPRLLLPWQLSALLGPIDRWVFIDSEHRLQSLEPHTGKRRLGSLQLTQEQWQAIRRIGLVNRYRELYRTLPGSKGLQAAPFEAVDALIVAAQGAGLEQRQDMAAFVLHGLTTHANFYRHPRMQVLLSRLGGRLNYVGLTNQLSDDEWNAISDIRESA